MQQRNIRTRLMTLITDPKKEFGLIKEENLSSGAILNQFVYPLFLVFMLTTLVGSIIFGAATFKEGIIVFVLSILITIPALLLSMYIGIWMLKKWVFKIRIHSNEFHFQLNDIVTPGMGAKSFTLISYSLAPVYLSMIVSGIFPRLSDLINLFGLYSISVYWQGSGVLFDYPLATRRKFVVASLLVFATIFMALRFGMKSLFGLLIN